MIDVELDRPYVMRELQSEAAISAIVALRQRAYLDRFGEAADASRLEWNSTDSKSRHFCLFAAGRGGAEILLSTLRLTYIESADEFAKVLRFSPEHEFSAWPSFCLARAATDPNSGEQQLNLRLRRRAYERILQEPRQATSVFGTALADSRRLPLLKTLGYQVLEHQATWQGCVRSGDQPVAIFKIAIDALAAALTNAAFSKADRRP